MTNLEGSQDNLQSPFSAVWLSEEAFSFACQTARIGLAEWDLQTEKIWWSPGMEKIYGLEPGDFGGTWTAFEQYVHPEDWSLMRYALEQAIRQEGDYELEFQGVTPSGRVLPLRSAGKIVQRQGRSILIEVVQPVMEMPDSKVVDVAQEIQWRRWMGCSRDVFFRLLPPDTILFVSDAVAVEFGHEPSVLAGQSFLLNVHRSEHDLMRSELQQLYRFGLDFTMRFRYWHHSGWWVNVEGYGCRLDEKELEYVFFVRDISSR